MNLKKKIKQELKQEFQQENQVNLQFETIASQNGFIKDRPVFHRNGYKIATCMLSFLLLLCLGFMIIQDVKGKNKINETIESTNPPLVDNKETDESGFNNSKQTITNEEIQQKAEIVDQIIKTECTNAPTVDSPSYGCSNSGGLNIQDIVTGVFVSNFNSIQNRGEITIDNEDNATDSQDGSLSKEKIYFYISKKINYSGVEEEYLMIKSNTYHNYQMVISYLNVNQKVTLVNSKTQTIDKIFFDASNEVKVEVLLYLEENLIGTYDIVIKR